MGIIDTQLKANADAIESASTGNYTGTAPITVDNGERTISVTSAVPQSSGSAGPLGVTRVTGIGSDWSAATATENIVPNRKAVADYVAAHGGTSYTGTAPINVSGRSISISNALPGTDGTDSSAGAVIVTGKADAINNNQNMQSYRVPNTRAVYDYVQQAMAAAGAAYTGTAPVVVDNGSHTISVNNASIVTFADGNYTQNPVKGTVNATLDKAATMEFFINGNTNGFPNNPVASVHGIREWVQSRTPDASTNVKGLVMLDTNGHIDSSTTALTGAGLKNMLATQRANATQGVTVSLLSKLYIDGVTGLVYYRA